MLILPLLEFCHLYILEKAINKFQFVEQLQQNIIEHSQATKRLAVFLYVTESDKKMKTYIYPENLRATVKLWFWNVRDFIIICGGIILSVVVLVNFRNVLPFAATACFAFLSLRVDETAIMDYIFNAAKFFLTSQQLYLWRKIK